MSGGSGKSSHQCTSFDNIKHLRIAIQPKGVIGLLSHIINKLFTSWNFVSKFNRAQLLGSFVNHMPSILNLGGFHSNFRCGMYLVLLLVFGPNHITIVFFNIDLQSRFISKIIEDPNRFFECFTLSILK